jgi:hypothetical protein
MNLTILIVALATLVMSPGSGQPASTVSPAAADSAKTECVAEVTPSAPNRWLDSKGTDNPTCGQDNPCKTIAHVLKFAGNLAISVAPGSYPPISITRSNVEIQGRLENGKRPTISSTAPELVVIKGSDIVFSGFEITNGEKFMPPCSKKEETKCAYGSTGIVVKSDSHRVTIVDNLIRYIGLNYSSCKPQGDCWGDSHGIQVESDIDEHGDGTRIDQIVIRGNTLSHLHLGRSEGITIGGNVTCFLVKDNVIDHLDNIAIDIVGKWHKCPPTSENADCQASDGRIIGNRLSDVYATDKDGGQYNPGQVEKDGKVQQMGAIYVDGGTRVTIEGNLVHSSAVGIDFGSEKGATIEQIVVTNNVSYANRSAAIKIGNNSNRTDEETGQPIPDTVVRNSRVANNTLVNNDTLKGQEWQGAIFFENSPANKFSDITVANNLVFNFDKPVYLITGIHTKVRKATFRNNLFFSKHKDEFTWEGTQEKSKSVESFDTFAQYAGASNVFTSDPTSGFFLNLSLDPTAMCNLDLLPSSVAAIGKADLSLLPGCDKGSCTDFLGRSRVIDGRLDIGAFQYQKPQK